MKYLLIDGNNLAVRCAFANEQLTNQDGVPTGVHYGVFQSLILLKNDFPEHQFLIVWDGKSARRIAEASEGVKNNIVPSGYKENRPTGDERAQPLTDFYNQASYLQKGIGTTGIPQIRLHDFEADDVIASYAKALKEHNEVVVVTSDKDYWQILDDNVSLWDGMKKEKTTKESWTEEYGLDPSKAIDIGAFQGDASDNIFGVPGWGMKTAVKEIKKYGSMEAVLKAYHDKYDALRNKYPDFKDDDSSDDSETKFKELATVKSNPKKESSRLKFPDIDYRMPFTGVCYAFHKGEVKMPKTELMALMFEERLNLAFSLKKMDDDIPELPIIEGEEPDMKKLIEYFEYYDITTLHDGIDVFGGDTVEEMEGADDLMDVLEN